MKSLKKGGTYRRDGGRAGSNRQQCKQDNVIKINYNGSFKLISIDYNFLVSTAWGFKKNSRKEPGAVK